MKKVIKHIGIGLTTIIILLLVTLLFFSPQSTPSINTPNSIALIEDIQLNGATQRIVIRGQNKNNPILLHLHGGAGAPDHAFWKHYDLNIEDIFTVIYWDQRGAGASYYNDIDPSSMSLDQLTDDGIALSRQLIKRFDKEKIYLQGHSFGTGIATHMAQKAPNLYHAFIGIGQLANKLLAEQRSYDFALDQSVKAGNLENVYKLKGIGRPPYANDSLTLAAVYVERPIMRQYENPYDSTPLSMFDIYKIFATYREYSISDKLRAIKGDPFSMRQLWPTIQNLDFTSQFPSWEIPVYMIQGKYDQHTVTSVARAYFDKLSAPTKQFFEFERSAHNPHLDQQEEYREVLKIIVKAKY